MSWWTGLVGAWTGLAACSVPAFVIEPGASPVSNSCEKDTDCAGVGICANSMCHASGGELSQITVEVVPPASSYFGAGDSFLVTLQDVSSQRGKAVDIKLPKYAAVVGNVLLGSNVLGGPIPIECAQVMGSDGSIGVRVDVSRSDAVYGLPAFRAAANATASNGLWSFALSIPPGPYDVYITMMNGCQLPPIFERGRVFEAGGASTSFTVPAISMLSGIVKLPLDGQMQPISLENWTVRLVEPAGGQVISTTRKLGASNPTNFRILYVPLAGGASPLLEISPPDGLLAPSVLWDLSVIDLDNDGQVGLDLGALSWSTVHVRARAQDQVSGGGLGDASVKIRSLQLNGANQGLTATYEATAKTAPTGDFDVTLLPGTYRVVVVPPSGSNAIAVERWNVGASPSEQAGRVAEVRRSTNLTGSIVEPVQGAPLSGIQVELVPMPVVSAVLAEALGLGSVVPRKVGGTTDGVGALLLSVDSGAFDFSVRPDDSSNYSWLVRAGLSVPESAGPTMDLGKMKLGFPVVVEGTVRDPDTNLVQQGLLRVFALVNRPSGSSGQPLPAAVQVAEARTDSGGHYRLLLPSSIKR